MIVELPQEIIDKIIDEIARDGSLCTRQILDLQASSVGSSALHHRSRKHLFREISFSDRGFLNWCTNVRPGEDGPSRHVTFIRLPPGFTVDLIRTVHPTSHPLRTSKHLTFTKFRCSVTRMWSIWEIWDGLFTNCGYKIA